MGSCSLVWTYEAPRVANALYGGRCRLNSGMAGEPHPLGDSQMTNIDSIGLMFTDVRQKSFVRNCIIEQPDNPAEAIFRQYPDGTVSIHLDGAAIISRRKYERLNAIVHERTWIWHTKERTWELRVYFSTGWVPLPIFVHFHTEPTL